MNSNLIAIRLYDNKEYVVKEVDKYIQKAFKNVAYYTEYDENHIICFVKSNEKECDIPYELRYSFYYINGMIYDSFYTSSYESFIKNYNSKKQLDIFDFLEE